MFFNRKNEKKEQILCRKVCNKNFELLKMNKYVVQEQIGISVISTGAKNFECFDCPYCGCQNIVNIREGRLEKNVSN